jgi:xanthine dehydrogenase YagR molybdenum-binding subunit
MSGVTGKGIMRVDAHLKVMGRADYAAETEVANVAHAVIITSTIARGRVRPIATQAARNAPGVLAVVTPSTVMKLPGLATKAGIGVGDRVLQVLQDDGVSYNDQPIAVVVADTLERAQYAASLIVPQYDEAAFTVDFKEQMPQAYIPAAAGPVGKPDTRRGADVDAALAAAKTKLVQTYTTPVENHNPMELHATIAVWHGDDALTVYDATQGIFGVKKRLATVFGLAPDKVRVISHYVGGGFGSKGSTWSHVVLAAVAAKAAGRPVKLMVTRPQMFSLVGHRPQTWQRVSLGADGGGKLVAIKHEVWSETSRFDEFVEPAAVQTRMLYACPSIATTHRLVRLDIPTPTFMRAPGEATGTFALESAMDELAYALKMDPIALRVASYADRDPEDDKPWSSKSLRECYRVGASIFGWAMRPARPRSMRKNGHFLVGQGMATATYPAHQRPASAVARMRPDGTALVQAGTQDIGTGTYTIMTQIAADAIGLPLERVHFELGDTALPETPVSGGSQTASSTGSAVKRAGFELRAKLVELATADSQSPLSGLAPDQIDAADGALFSTTNKGLRDPFDAIVARSGKSEIVAEVANKPKNDRGARSTHSFGAQFVEVTVDEALGEIRVSRMVGAFAAGKILNEKTARSQLMGGMIFGLGLALFENTARDLRTGRVSTRDLADYHVPVNADAPAIDVVMVREDDPFVNEVGAKGIGELGITGVGAAVANAVYHATGRRIRDLPITLDKLL